MRMLLDQCFPKPIFDVEQMDQSVEYVHLYDWAPDLAKRSTPDWFLHLAAEAGGFDGLITGDFHSLEQPHEVVALDCTRLSLVTWSGSINNPIVQWGSLLAYIPQVRKTIEERGPSIIRLPVPRLNSDHVEKTRGVSTRYAGTERQTRTELRAEVLPYMRSVLAAKKRPDLAELLDHVPKRSAKGKPKAPSRRKRPSA